MAKRQIPIPDVCPPLLNFGMSQILMKLNPSIMDPSAVPRIIIMFKEEICSVYTSVTNDAFIIVCFGGRESKSFIISR